MCGIAGLLDLKRSRSSESLSQITRTMTDTMIHRGPDGGDIWVDGETYRLAPGDCAGFPAGTGIAHTIINNTDTDVVFFVVGERDKEKTRLHYPMHPARNAEIGARHWKEAEGRPLGPHDGKPDALREREA